MYADSPFNLLLPLASPPTTVGGKNIAPLRHYVAFSSEGHLDRNPLGPLALTLGCTSRLGRLNENSVDMKAILAPPPIQY